MKKCVLFVIIITVGLFSVFAQNDGNSENIKNEENEISFSILNEKYLVNVSDFFSNASYQNPNGEKFKHSQVNKMLLTVPENETVIKKYNTWTVVTYVLLGVACAGIATDVIYTFNDDLPYRETVIPVSSYGTFFSVLGALFTSKVAGSTYKIAVDNYNLNLLGIEQ